MAIIRVEKRMTIDELGKSYPYKWATIYDIEFGDIRLVDEATVFEVGDYGDQFGY